MRQGFTATELVVVLVVLGLLATLSLSRFYAYLAKGRQAEAAVSLSMIGGLQETWRFSHGSYNSAPGGGGVGAFSTDKCGNTPGQQTKNELGFRPKNCPKLRYGYNWDGSSATATSTTRKAKLIYPGCSEVDKWELTYSSGSIENTDKVVDKCK